MYRPPVYRGSSDSAWCLPRYPIGGPTTRLPSPSSNACFVCSQPAGADTSQASYAGSIEDLQKFSRVIPVSKWNSDFWHKPAQYGPQDILAWLESEAPRSMPRAECAIRAAEKNQTNILHHMRIDNELTGVHVIAAGQGRWKAAQIICQFPKQLPWVQHPDFRLLEHAVRQGKADFLEWALHCAPTCPISIAILDLAMRLMSGLTCLVHHDPAIQGIMFIGTLQTGNPPGDHALAEVFQGHRL